MLAVMIMSCLDDLSYCFVHLAMMIVMMTMITDDDENNLKSNLVSIRKGGILISSSSSFNDGERRHNEHYNWDVLPIPEILISSVTEINIDYDNDDMNMMMTMTKRTVGTKTMILKQS